MPSAIASSIRRKARRRPPVGRTSGVAQPALLAWWQKDLGGHYLRASANYCRFFRLSAIATPIGHRDRDLFPSSVANRREEGEHRLILSGEPQVVEEVHNGCRGKLIMTPLFDATGRICGIHGVVCDISGDRHRHPAMSKGEHDYRMRLRKSQELLRKLAIRRQQEQEEVRRDITHRMHEELAQELSALRLHLKLLARELPDQSNPLLGLIDDITARCIARIRDMVKTLRPRALDLGIVPALRWLADDFYQGLELEFSLDLPEHLEVSDPIATFLFRSAQEALLNVALHAAATHIAIRLDRTRGGIRLQIGDNGSGFDTEQPAREGAIGLLGLAEQALHLGGQLRVRSSPQNGTTVIIEVPFQPRRKSQL